MTLMQSEFESARVYHDFNSLAQLRTKGKEDNPEAIREAASQFESVFVRMMLKSMRDANAAIIDEPLFDSAQMDLYKDMHDDQLSLHLSSSASGLGLTDILVQQLTGDQTRTTRKNNSEPVYKPEIVSKTRQVIKSANATTILAEQRAEINSNVAMESQSIGQTRPDISIDVTENNVVETQERGIDFSTPAAFVQSLWPYARKAAKLLQLDPKVLIAQAALETGWGKKVMRTEQGESSKNMFGIKTGNSWQGGRTLVNTLEMEDGTFNRKTAEFRSYASYEESFADYVHFINDKNRYQKAREVAAEPDNYVQELQSAGYATDPHYANKISSIYRSPLLNNAIRTFVDNPE